MQLVQTAFEESLRAAGYSLTSPRQRVFTALQEHEPQTMQELAQRCSGINRASVYRTVTLFEMLGIVQRLQIGWKYKLELTDTFSEHHHHLSCLKCGKIVPLAEDHKLEMLLANMTAQHQFIAHDHQLEIRGVCQDCQLQSARMA